MKMVQVAQTSSSGHVKVYLELFQRSIIEVREAQLNNLAAFLCRWRIAHRIAIFPYWGYVFEVSNFEICGPGRVRAVGTLWEQSGILSAVVDGDNPNAGVVTSMGWVLLLALLVLWNNSHFCAEPTFATIVDVVLHRLLLSLHLFPLNSLHDDADGAD
jgi:hypothetical protein